MLVYARANTSARDGDWNTPLHLAAKYGRVEAVKYLMQVADELQAEKNDGKQNRGATDGDLKAIDEEEEYNPFGRDYSFLDEAILNGQRYSNCNMYATHACIQLQLVTVWSPLLFVIGKLSMSLLTVKLLTMNI